MSRNKIDLINSNVIIYWFSVLLWFQTKYCSRLVKQNKTVDDTFDERLTDIVLSGCILILIIINQEDWWLILGTVQLYFLLILLKLQLLVTLQILIIQCWYARDMSPIRQSWADAEWGHRVGTTDTDRRLHQSQSTAFFI